MSKSFAANFHKIIFSDIKTQTQIPLLALDEPWRWYTQWPQRNMWWNLFAPPTLIIIQKIFLWANFFKKSSPLESRTRHINHINHINQIILFFFFLNHQNFRSLQRNTEDFICRTLSGKFMQVILKFKAHCDQY